ncbi:MAG: redoxin domain-containing protein [Bacilli bacterium]|nr:redoxin domain-containing protein [Bacilli bacterium]
MKRIIKACTLIFVLVLLFTVASCKSCKKQKDPVIESIQIVESSVPSKIYTTEVSDKLDDIQIQVLKSDGSSDTINLATSMISSDDLAKLNTAGTHTIKVSYEGFEATLTINVEVKNNVNNNPTDIEYTVLVKDIAGKPLKGFYVMFYDGDEKLTEGYTNAEGKFVTNLSPKNYDVVVEGRDGYYLNREMFQTDLIGSVIEVEAEIESLKGVEGDIFTTYELGDVMYDFTLTNTEGESLSLYDLLEKNKLVILNFWYTTCSACYYEFPYMVEAYESTYIDSLGNKKAYKDDVVIIAINPTIAGNGDTLDDVKGFKESMGLTFDVALDIDGDTENLTFDPLFTNQFSISAYPTTIFIDSYGLIAEIGVGAVTATDKWTQTFDKYLQDDYYPTYTGQSGEENYMEEPDIQQEDSSVLEDAVNGTNHDGSRFEGTYSPEDGDDAKYSWPWVVEEFNGKQTIKPSNQDKNPSYSIVYITTYLKVGEVLTFDYFSSTEEYDYLYVIVDNAIATQIVGKSLDWETSYAYLALEEREYEIAFCYLKDESYSSGEDAVYVSNIRILREEDIDKETYIFRECATGSINEFTMSYQNYVNVVYNEEDGYYHVGTATGPYLLADMLSGTKWNNSTLYEICLEGKCIGADGVDYNAVIEEYSIYASNSEVGYTPVTKVLADALKEVCKALGDDLAKNNQNQWLEVCVYYSAYGTGGKELGLPTVGVMPFEPIMFEGNGIYTPATASGMIDRIILPRGIIFGFIPEKSGVYKFYSTEQIETQGWICDENGEAIAEPDYGLREYAKILSNGGQLDDNFVAYIYLEQGKLYLFRACFYDINEYSSIEVEMSFVADTKELLTVASPGFFTSSDDEMSDIISGNYVDVEIGDDGFYHVKDSLASDNYVYCDMAYINNITGVTLLQALSSKYNAFDFSRDEFGQKIVDEDGYYRVTYFDDQNNMIRYYVCYDKNNEYFEVENIGDNGYTEENGYTYVKFTDEDLEKIGLKDYTEYVTEYVNSNMVTNEHLELYGCVKVDEQFAKVLGLLMDKYTFEGVEFSWLKLCYYFKYLGPTSSN